MENVQLALNTSRTYFLISGIANALAAVFGLIWVIVGGVATCGIGCLFFFVPMINAAILVFDFLAMSKIQQPPSPSNYSFLKMVTIFDMFACFVVIPLVMGILNLQLLGKPEVYQYFHSDQSS